MDQNKLEAPKIYINTKNTNSGTRCCCWMGG